MAPGDRGAQRLLACRQVPRAACQQAQGAAQPLEDNLRREQFAACRGKLDRQRQAIQPHANLGHGRRVGVRNGEIRPHRLRSLDEQLHRFILAHSLRRGIGCAAGQVQRWDGELVLTAQMQRHAAGDERFDTPGGCEQLTHQWRRRYDLLEVVQHQQQLLLT